LVAVSANILPTDDESVRITNNKTRSGQMNLRRLTLSTIVATVVACAVVAPAHSQPRSGPPSLTEIRERAVRDGNVRVLVEVGARERFRPEAGLGRAAALQQRARIREVRQRVLSRVGTLGARARRQFDTVPWVALDADAATIDALSADADVGSIRVDSVLSTSLEQSIPLIEADTAHQMGLTGVGTTIAVLDTGVDGSHPFLAGKVVEEACFSDAETGTGGDCPNGQTTQVGPGSAVPCTYAEACIHGTHVAGIAAGTGASFVGAAPAARLISIQVFHRMGLCGLAGCAGAWESDILAGLEQVYALRDRYAIAAVNMSLGGDLYTNACDASDPAFAQVVENLRAARIATVIAAGNNGAADGLSFPACISSAVSVGATDDSDQVAYFSNDSADLDLFAPGVSINSSVPGGGFRELSGTSMAAPHVAGVWAIMRQAYPTETVDEILATLKQTGRPVGDSRGSVPLTKPRIRVSGAVGVVSPAPTVQAATPTVLDAFSSDTSVTISGSGFMHGSYVTVNGAPRPAALVDATTLVATVTAGDLATGASSLSLRVVNPPPGGGSTAAIDIAVVPPTFTFSKTTALPGETVTVSWSRGPTSSGAWVALSAVGAADTAPSTWWYISKLPTANTWSFVAPDKPGNYEIRLYPNTAFTRGATSGPLTVLAPPAPTPGTLSVSTTQAAVGQSVTVSLNGGSGGALDWLALSVVGSPASSFERWTYVPQGQTSFAWTVSMPTTPGDYEFRLYLNNGTTPATTSPVVHVTANTPPPPSPGNTALAVNNQLAAPGDSITLTLTGAPGGATDWLAFAPVGSASSSYLSYVYVGAGVTTRTWTVTAPSAAGDYEFRFLPNNGYVVTTTSPPVTVRVTPPPAPTLTVDKTSAAVGQNVTVTVSGASGSSSDWLALAPVGSADTAYVKWTYLAAGQTTFSWTTSMPSPAQDYEFRLYRDGGYTRAATSPVVHVTANTPPPPSPGNTALAVNNQLAAPGDSITLTLTGAPGGATDWLAFAPVGSASSSYLSYVYVGAGVTTRTWTVTAPSAAGDYEFRFLPNNGYVVTTTSPPVTVRVTPPPAPTLTVDKTSAAVGQNITVTVSGASGSSSDWLALAPVGSADTAYVKWTYLAAGQTTFSWTTSMPTTAGTYEFRFYSNNSYTRGATSAAITVLP
jgi:subtilisin family serine protease/uncharacterized protein YegP (UPF0339 family)